MIDRRGFLASLAAVAVAPFVPMPAKPQLAFHSKAFVMAMETLELPQRLDCIYGFGCIAPYTTVRGWDA